MVVVVWEQACRFSLEPTSQVDVQLVAQPHDTCDRAGHMLLFSWPNGTLTMLTTMF